MIKRATHGGFWLPIVVAIAAFPGRIAAAPTIRQPPSVWELTPDLRFGDQGFTHILAILPDSDGSIVVADDRNQEVLVLSRDGSPSHRIGTNGRGPGEFLRVRGIGELGDTIGVIDRDRVALFLRDGTSVGVIRRESRGTLRALVPGGALGTESPLMSAEGMPPRLPVLRMTRGGATLDTIAWLPSRNMYIFLGPLSGGRYDLMLHPFSDAGLTILASGGSRLYIVDRSAAASPEGATFGVTAMDPGGDTLWTRTYPYVARENTQADSTRDALMTTFIRSGHSRDAIEARVFIPDYYPPVTSGFASDGWLWLRREEVEGTVDYWIIRADGELGARLSVPSNTTLMAALGTYVWGVETDENDVPSIVRFRLQRR